MLYSLSQDGNPDPVFMYLIQRIQIIEIPGTSGSNIAPDDRFILLSQNRFQCVRHHRNSPLLEKQRILILNGNRRDLIPCCDIHLHGIFDLPVLRFEVYAEVIIVVILPDRLDPLIDEVNTVI